MEGFTAKIIDRITKACSCTAFLTARRDAVAGGNWKIAIELREKDFGDCESALTIDNLLKHRWMLAYRPIKSVSNPCGERWLNLLFWLARE
jgi:hypothetical protein